MRFAYVQTVARLERPDLGPCVQLVVRAAPGGPEATQVRCLAPTNYAVRPGDLLALEARRAGPAAVVWRPRGNAARSVVLPLAGAVPRPAA